MYEETSAVCDPAEIPQLESGRAHSSRACDPHRYALWIYERLYRCLRLVYTHVHSGSGSASLKRLSGTWYALKKCLLNERMNVEVHLNVIIHVFRSMCQER